MNVKDLKRVTERERDRERSKGEEGNRIEDTFYRRQNASAAERGLQKRQLYNCYVTMYASQIRERRKDRQRGGSAKAPPPQSMRDTVTVRNVIRENCEREMGAPFEKRSGGMKLVCMI